MINPALDYIIWKNEQGVVRPEADKIVAYADDVIVTNKTKSNKKS